MSQRLRPHGFARTGLICFGLLLTTVAIFSWYFQAAADTRERIALSLERYDRLRAIIGIASDKQASRSTGVNLDAESLFLPEGTPAVVSANLLAGLSQLAERRGVGILRSSDLPAKNEGALVFAGARLDMTGPIAGIYELLQDIDAARPPLLVDRLVARSDAANGNDGSADTLLYIELDVMGAIRGGANLAASQASP